MDELVMMYRAYMDGDTNIHGVIVMLNGYIGKYKWFGTDTDKPEPADIFVAKAMLVRFVSMI